MFGDAQMIKFTGRRSNPDYIKKKVSVFQAIYILCFSLGAVLFIYMIGCIAVPNHFLLINNDITAMSIIVQAALFLIAINCYVYVDKLKIVFKVNLYKIPKEGKNRISKRRSYRLHLKKRLKVFIIFEIFFVVFFILSIVITQIFGKEFSTLVFNNKFLTIELILLIYTVVELIAMAINLMHVNYLIQLCGKVFRKKPDPKPVIHDYYDYD